MAIRNTKDRDCKTYESGIMPDLERKFINIDWLISSYESGYTRHIPIPKLGYSINKTTDDWIMGVQRGWLDPIKINFFYYNGTLFEVKIKHPDQHLSQNQNTN